MTSAAIIAIGAFAISGTALVGGAVLITAFQVGMVVVASAIANYAAYQNRKKRAELEDASKGAEITIEGVAYKVPIAYGRCKIGGARTWHDVSNIIQGTGMAPEAVEFSSYTANDWTKWVDSSPCSKISATVAKVGGVYRVPTNTEGIPWSDITPASALEVREHHELALGINLVVSKDGFNRYTLTTGIIANQDWLFNGLSVMLTHNSFINYDHWFGIQVPSGQMTLPYLIIAYDKPTGVLTLEGLDPKSNGLLGEPILSDSIPNENGDRHEFMYFKQVMCYKGIHRVVYPEIDEKSVNTENLNARLFYYNQGGIVDPLINANFTGQSNSHYHETANLTAVVKLNRDDPQYSGVPGITTQLEGMEVASIEQSLGYPPIYTLSNDTYTNNPVRLLVDYLTNSEYGKGLLPEEIDLESFYIAAKICNRLVPVNGVFDLTPRGPFWQTKVGILGERYNLHLFEYNGIVETGTDVRTGIETILSSLGDAYLSWAEGKYSLIFTYHIPYEPVFTYTSLGSLSGDPVVAGQPSFYDKDDTVYYLDDLEFGYEVMYLARSVIDHNMSDPRDPSTHGITWILVSPYSFTLDGEQSPTNNTPYGVVQELVTDDDIILDSTVSYTWNDAAARFNFATVKFNNDEKGFIEETASWPPKYDPTNPVYETFLAEDNGYFLETEATLSYCTTYWHALAYAEFIVRLSRSKTTINLGVSRKLLGLIPGDIIRVDSEYLNIRNQLLKVVEIKPTTFKDAGILEITGYIYDPRQLAWNAKDDQIIDDVQFYSNAIKQASNLHFTPSTTYNSESSGELTWDSALDSSVEKYAILIANIPPESVTTETNWTEVGITSETKFALPLVNYNYYTVAVVSIAANGRRAPRMDLSTGSHWPLLAILSANSTLTVTIRAVPPSILVQDDANGNVNYGPAMTQLKVSLGLEDLIGESVFAVNDQRYCTATVSPTGIVHITQMTATTSVVEIKVTVRGKDHFIMIYSYYGGGTAITGEIGITPQPANPQMTTGFTFYYLEVNPVQYTVNGGHKSTRIYAALKKTSNPPTVLEAKVALESPSFGNFVDAEPGDIWYVWVCFVANNGVESAKTGPIVAQIGLNTTTIFDRMQTEISNTVLQKDVAADIDALAQEVIGINGDLDSLINSDAAIRQDIANLKTADITINQSIVALQNADVQLAASITTLQTADVTINQSLVALQTSDGQQAQAITNLQTADVNASQRMTAIETVNTQQATAITNLQTTDTGITQSLSALQNTDNTMMTNWSIKSQIATGGGGAPYITGVGLFSQNGAAGPTSTFNVMVDAFIVGAPNYGAAPFEVHTVPFFVDGYTYPAGVYATNFIAKDAQITNAKIANLAVDNAKIKDLAVSTAKIADLAVNNAKITDLAVTNAKIGDLQVNTLKIAGKSVTVGTYLSITMPASPWSSPGYPLNTPVPPSCVNLNFNLYVYGYRSESSWWVDLVSPLNVYRDGVLIQQQMLPIPDGWNNISAMIIDILPVNYSGSPTYSFYVGGSNGGPMDTSVQWISATVSIAAMLR